MNIRATFDQKKYLQMDPLELVEKLGEDVQFTIPENVETKDNQTVATMTITKATAYASYFAEMEMKAKLLKRAAKNNKDKDEAERLLGVEEVFKSFKEISKMQIENVAKIMTLKRLELDEMRANGRTI